MGDFAAAAASDFWSHPKVTKRWPGDGQGGLGLRPPPSTALPPDPTTGAQRPCTKPKPQNLIWNTPPCCFAKFGGFTGDQQYGPPRYRQNLFLMLLTSVASRGRPVGRATESSFAQRGGAAQPRITPHNSETQVPIFSGCLYSNSLRSGLKARMAGQQNQGMCAGREAGFFEGRPLGTGAEAPEIFWVLLYLYKSTSPGGETSFRPNFRPARGRNPLIN